LSEGCVRNEDCSNARIPRGYEMKIDNGTGGSRATSTGTQGSRLGRSAVDERGRESINFFAELKRRNVYKVAVAVNAILRHSEMASVFVRFNHVA